MNKFSNKTISQIGSYVYRLVDPKNGESITKIIGIILFNLEGTELENIGIEKWNFIADVYFGESNMINYWKYIKKWKNNRWKKLI